MASSTRVSIVVVAFLAHGMAGLAQQPVPITFETLVDQRLKDELSVPQHVWLDDGSLLLFDRRVETAQRTIERFDPRTLTRSPACDAAASLASLRSLLGDDDEPVDGLPWPDVVSADGRHAVYALAGDLFLLDLGHSVFRRLTRTTEAEKNPVLSPDGRYLAFVRANDLFVLELKTGSEEALTKDGSPTLLNATLSWVYWEEVFGRRDTAFWWSPDSQAIAFLQTDESQVDESVQLEYEPATPRLIPQRYAKAGHANPVVRVGVVALDGKSTVWMDTGSPTPEWVIRVKWLPDSSRLAIQTMPRSQKRLDLLLADRRTGKSRAVLTEHSETYVNVHDDLHFVDEGSKLIWASERSGQYRYGLFDLDGSLVRWLDLGDLVVRSSARVFWVKAGICAIDEVRRMVYFTATQGSPIAPNLYRVSWEGGPAEEVVAGKGTHRISFDHQARFFLDEHSTLNRPASLTVRAADGQGIAVIAPSAQECLADYQLQYAETMVIPAADGFPLPARISKPRDFDPSTSYPLIVHVYGGPSAPLVHDAWDRRVLMKNMLLAEGFLCIEIDNRCATGLSKTLEELVHGRMLAGSEVDDIVAAVRWLKRQSFVDPDRVGVWGWSGGGTLTLQLMTHCEEFRAGIAGAAVTDFRYYDSLIAERYIGLPEENPEGYAASAPAKSAASLSGRLLLIHGGLDDNVHPQNAWRFAHELQKAGITFDMMVYPMAKHGVRDPSEQKHLAKTMVEFWQRWLR